MSRALITESYLTDIANAIRAKLGVQDTYTPPQMAAAIESIPTGGITPTGTKQITQNGTHDVTQYASANVNVPNSYAAADEGKVVSNGALVAQTSRTITENGTYDTTENNEVVVNVSGGGVNNLVADWDFTQSLTDSVSGMVAALNGGCTQDSGGLQFTAARQYVTLNGSNAATFFPDRTIELDIASMNLQGSNSSHYTLLTHDSPTTSGAYGFLYRDTGYWALYDGTWRMTTIAEKNFWSGKTLGMYLSTEGTIKIYENGVLAATLPYLGMTRRIVIGNGREQISGGQIYNTTITGCRIYRGNHYE